MTSYIRLEPNSSAISILGELCLPPEDTFRYYIEQLRLTSVELRDGKRNAHNVDLMAAGYTEVDGVVLQWQPQFGRVYMAKEDSNARYVTLAVDLGQTDPLHIRPKAVLKEIHLVNGTVIEMDPYDPAPVISYKALVETLDMVGVAVSHYVVNVEGWSTMGDFNKIIQKTIPDYDINTCLQRGKLLSFINRSNELIPITINTVMDNHIKLAQKINESEFIFFSDSGVVSINIEIREQTV